MALPYATEIFPRRQQFSKYHPQKQKLHVGKQSQCNANWVGPVCGSQKPALFLSALARSEGYDPLQTTSWNFLGCKVGILIYFTKKLLYRGTQKTECPQHSAWQVLSIPSPNEPISLPFHRYHVSPSHLVACLGDQSDLLIALCASTKAPIPTGSMLF